MSMVKGELGATSAFRRGAHIVAIVTALAFVPLIFIGAGVTSKDAGMAFSTWPDSDGHFINPLNWWQDIAKRWEHSHRLKGWVVGMLCILTVMACWRSGRVASRLALGTLLAVIVQGVLGGLRVLEISTPLAMIHGMWGQVCFCFAWSTVLVTSRVWTTSGPPHAIQAASLLRKLALVCVGATCVQLTLGAAVRHFDCTGSLVTHVLFAIVVSFLIGWLGIWIMGQSPTRTLLGRLGLAMLLLIGVQLFLGGMAFLSTVSGVIRSPLLVWVIPTAHVVVGASLLVCCVITTMCCHRFLTDACDEQGAADATGLPTT